MANKIRSRRSQQSKSQRTRRPRIENLEDRRLLASFEVTSDLGAGPGSLRAMITQANNSPDADEITFHPSLAGATISIQNPLPEIAGEVSITGIPTAGLGFFDPITIDAGGNPFRVLTINAFSSDVTISHLKLTGGDLRTVSPGPNGESFGGGLWNVGLRTTLNNVEISGNFAHSGGGIYNVGNSVEIHDSTISDNVATSTEGDVYGGGIFQGTGSTLIYDSVIEGNVAVAGTGFQAFGGGLATTANEARLERTSIRDNSAGNSTSDGHGGGVSATNFGQVRIKASTVRENAATGDGGGVHVHDGKTNIQSATIVNNTADGDGGGLSVSGRFTSTIDAEADIFNATITGNTAGNSGGGMYVTILKTEIDMYNTVVALNHAAAGEPVDITHVGSFQTYENSWNGEIDGNPLLMPLADYGGPTLTRLPFAISPLIDAGHPDVAPSVDQRGNERVQDGDGDGTAIVDIGATEFSELFRVRGQIVNDLNENSTQDAGEGGFDGVTVQLFALGGIDPLDETTTSSIDLNNDGTIDPETETGVYEFRRIEAGNYRVEQVFEGGYHTDFVSQTITVTDSDVEDVDFFNQRAAQIVSGTHALFDLADFVIPVPTETDIELTIHYDTSDGNEHTTGVAVRMHFDSSWLTFESIDNAHEDLFHTEQVMPDTDDYDNDPATDQFLLVPFIDTGARFPGNSLPDDIFKAVFSYDPAAGGNATGSTTIHFTAVTQDVRYDFVGEDIDIEFVPATLDVDGNGVVDALTDGLLIHRHMVGAFGDELTEFAIGPGATRTTWDEIFPYLQPLESTMLDPDGDGFVLTFFDGFLISRYMLGYRGDALVDGIFIDSFAPRTTADDIVSYLDGFLPAPSSSSPGDALVIVAEGEWIGPAENVSTPAGMGPPEIGLLPAVQQVSATAKPGEAEGTLQVDLHYQTTPEARPSAGLATRVHFDSSKLELLHAEHFADDHFVDQVMADTEDWDNDPSTDLFFLNGFLDLEAAWDGKNREGKISSIDFAVVDRDAGPTSLNFTAVETPPRMLFEGSSATLALSHTNPLMKRDVNHDGRITALDALLIINQLERESQALAAINTTSYSVDVNEDDRLSALDALWVINALDED